MERAIGILKSLTLNFYCWHVVDFLWDLHKMILSAQSTDDPLLHNDAKVTRVLILF